MSAAARLAAFAVALGLSLGTGAALGGAVGPDPDDTVERQRHERVQPVDHEGGDHK